MKLSNRGRRTPRRMFAIVLILAMALMKAGILPAHATNPGRNGRIAFAMDKGSGTQVYSIKRDGTGLRKLTSASGCKSELEAVQLAEQKARQAIAEICPDWDTTSQPGALN